MILEQEVSKYIDNLRGRKAYEQKRSQKLGFKSFEEYIEHKLLKKLGLNNSVKHENKSLSQNKNIKKDKIAATSSCSCCSN